MKNFTVFVGFILLLWHFSFGQSTKYEKRDRHRFFLSVGATNFLGDLGGANLIGSEPFSLRDFDVQSIKPAFQLGYSYRFHKHFATRSAFTYFWLSGNDALTKETFRQNRNLNFRCPVYDLSSVIEFIWEYRRKGHRYYLKGINGWKNVRYSSYIYAGAALNYFRSQGKLDDHWYALRPLSTEGQGLVSTRKKYSPVQFSIPLGIGFRARVSRTLEIGIEYTARITFTDYIDDVSTTYFDENALLAAKGQIAVDLANPALDRNPGDPLYTSTRPSQQRGDVRDKDGYLAVMLTVYYTFDKKIFISKYKTRNLKFKPRKHFRR